MTAPVLLLAVGNPSRGDDALGPMLLNRLAPWLVSAGLAEKIELLEDFQLQIEHAADMRERRQVLFVDAGANTAAPYLFRPIHASSGRPLLSHALPPEDVLASYAQVYQEPPPPSFLLCISGARFILGEALSANAVRHLEAAEGFTRRLLKAESPDAWRALTGARTDAECT